MEWVNKPALFFFPAMDSLLVSYHGQKSLCQCKLNWKNELLFQIHVKKIMYVLISCVSKISILHEPMVFSMQTQWELKGRLYYLIYRKRHGRDIIQVQLLVLPETMNELKRWTWHSKLALGICCLPSIRNSPHPSSFQYHTSIHSRFQEKDIWRHNSISKKTKRKFMKSWKLL